jgi:hypothetical protein
MAYESNYICYMKKIDQLYYIIFCPIYRVSYSSSRVRRLRLTTIAIVAMITAKVVINCLCGTTAVDIFIQLRLDTCIGFDTAYLVILISSTSWFSRTAPKTSKFIRIVILTVDSKTLRHLLAFTRCTRV